MKTEAVRARQKEYYLRRRPHILERGRRAALWRAFKITPDDYNALWLEQDGKCYLCHKAESTGTLLSVDHNHATGEVRHLLCKRCNLWIAGYEYIVASVGESAVKAYLGLTIR